MRLTEIMESNKGKDPAALVNYIRLSLDDGIENVIETAIHAHDDLRKHFPNAYMMLREIEDKIEQFQSWNYTQCKSQTPSDMIP